MPASIHKPAPAYRSAAFLRWAHEQPGGCCLCRTLLGHYPVRPGGPVELHHYGDKGMAQKASDLLVARVCREHHALVQGKRSSVRFAAFGMSDVYEEILADNVRLLAGYVEHLEQRGRR